MIEQDGLYYLAAIPGPGSTTIPFSTGYVALSQSGLLATDFVQFDFSTDSFGTAHPNFSGDPMLFGIGQISGQSGFTNLVGTAQYDNLRIAVIPEPATLALLGVGLAGIGFSRRRKLN